MNTDLTSPQTAQPATDDPRIDRIANAFSQALDEATATPTAYKDHTPVPAIGATPPVPQPDSRIVPQWATGIAVASLGIGAGTTGLGCAAWLVFKGLSLVSLPNLQTFALILLAPFAGLAALTVAIGAAIAKAKNASTTNVYKGSVTVSSKTEVHSTARGMFARNRNQLPR